MGDEGENGDLASQQTLERGALPAGKCGARARQREAVGIGTSEAWRDGCGVEEAETTKGA